MNTSFSNNVEWKEFYTISVNAYDTFMTRRGSDTVIL